MTEEVVHEKSPMGAFAKVKDDALVIYPYNVSDFIKENPYTKIPSKPLNEAYEGTEDQISSGCSVVSVGVQRITGTTYNIYTHKVDLPDQPSYVDGNWVRVEQIVALEGDELAVQQDAKTQKPDAPEIVQV